MPATGGVLEIVSLVRTHEWAISFPSGLRFPEPWIHGGRVKVLPLAPVGKYLESIRSLALPQF